VAADSPLSAFSYCRVRAGREVTVGPDAVEECVALSPSTLSLADFVRANDLALTRFAYLVTGDRMRAEDTVQDVLLAMYRRFGAVLDLADPVGYARRSIVNAEISRRRRRRVHEVSTEAPDLRAADDRPPVDTLDGDVWDAVRRLPHRQRAVLVMRYYLGYSDHEIADALSCRESSVRSLAARAFKVLRPIVRPVGNVRLAEGLPT
jgi:RNA polymerase sigma-70 factor (sigma-E family)